jgi:uncharacterized protein (TIGR03067 family)
MNHTSSSTILGKWKLVETRADLNSPKPVKNGGQGEIIEFIADGQMRRPGARESRSKAYGSVLYRVDPEKDPAHFDTLYASGMALRTGIYRLVGDRLIICSTTSVIGPARRPVKFGGFTKAEEDRLRSIDIYERVTTGPSKKAEAAKPAIKALSARLREAERLLTYLRQSSKTPPQNPGVGLPAEWIPVAEFEVVSSSVWAGDPLCMNEEDGCLVELPAGTYILAAQGMDFDGFRVVGRVRVYPKTLRPGRLKTGRAIGKTGTDSAAITVCDLRGLLPVIAGQESLFQRALEKQLRGRCGLLTSKLAPGVALPFLQSGFGDGTGPVYALQANGRRVGLELAFVEW